MHSNSPLCLIFLHTPSANPDQFPESVTLNDVLGAPVVQCGLSLSILFLSLLPLPSREHAKFSKPTGIM